jgi:hypothetical protein
VTDFFDQAFTTYHHSDGPSFYLALDEPVDGVHALWIPRDPTEGLPTQVQYLDAAGQVIETRAILSITGMD